MLTLFNDDWQFFEYSIDEKQMTKNGAPVLLKPQDFFEISESVNYAPVTLPHDWQIEHVKKLYANSAGLYKKTFSINQDFGRVALRFEGVYMNSAVYVNGQLAGECKYGYSTFEIDITSLLHKNAPNVVQVICVYQNPNTRWYSGAGIFRDVWLVQNNECFLPLDGTYFVASKQDEDTWNVFVNQEIAFAGYAGLNGKDAESAIAGNLLQVELVENSTLKTVFTRKYELDDIKSQQQSLFAHFDTKQNGLGLQNSAVFHKEIEFEISHPNIWDVENPLFYLLKISLINKNCLDCKKNAQTGQSARSNHAEQTVCHAGFKTSVFDKDKGYFLNGRHLKLHGVCQHHDFGALGSAFNLCALKRQFEKLKEMGVNSIRCSHNPPAKAFMNLADEMGFLIIDESFDMWQKCKTAFDYANYFDRDCKKDTASWVRRDRNHPCLLMWSIGNEIYDTHAGNGYEITKKLYDFVVECDPKRVAPITIASNYMMGENAQKSAGLVDVAGYNYLERLYDSHHEKYPSWCIYGSETSSTVQSRGIYHFPEDLCLVTYDDQQCSSLGNCTTTWGARNTQFVLTHDRDHDFSAGQYIWTGWDYIGEPTPYHSKNSFFGQIDTAGFEKDTFYLYKAFWNAKAEPFVHILPYWDFNVGQIIDVKVYTNVSSIELFLNGKSLGKKTIDFARDSEPFGQWRLAYQPGELKTVAYGKNGEIVASEEKHSFSDPVQIIAKVEEHKDRDLLFINLMCADKNNHLVENAKNYITVSVSGDARLLGLDNGDSTDYEEYKAKDNLHCRKLFSNRLLAIVKPGKTGSFSVHSASLGLKGVTLAFNGQNYQTLPLQKTLPLNSYVPVRKIELFTAESKIFSSAGEKKLVFARVLPENASDRQITFSAVQNECVKSDCFKVETVKSFEELSEDIKKRGDIKNNFDQCAVISPLGDGSARLRCTAANQTGYSEIISDLEFEVQGLGNPNLNPFKLIEACKMNDWGHHTKKPAVSFLGGAHNRSIGATWFTFNRVDFGEQGGDVLHLPVFSFDRILPFEVYDGTPENGNCILRAEYKAESVYNTYQENVFVLDRRLFGVHQISLNFLTELSCQGFYFEQTPKAFSRLSALDANVIVGDSFSKCENGVFGIGNNVNLDFEAMNFSEKGAGKLTVCGKSNCENNSINVKFFAGEDVVTQLIEFARSDDFIEKTFEIKPVPGTTKVSFVFLPGSNFDFKWFQFKE